MASRHRGRRLALQALYALEMNPSTTLAEAIGQALAELEATDLGDEFAQGLAEGAWRARRELDRVIEGASRRWKIGRMDRVDVSLLRLGTHELLSAHDTPAAVILDEAVELAKEFGTPESSAFVNGILDRIARDARPGEVGGKGA